MVVDTSELAPHERAALCVLVPRGLHHESVLQRLRALGDADPVDAAFRLVDEVLRAHGHAPLSACRREWEALVAECSRV